MKAILKPIAYLVTALLVVGGGAYALNSNKEETYEVKAYFEKAIGLFPNSDVTILGVAVGKVTEVDPQGEVVEITMKIPEEYKIPADATAQIVPISVISDRFIEFAPVYESGPALEDGDEIPIENTQIPAELDDVFKQLKKLLDAIEPGEEGEPGALGGLIVQLDETLRDRSTDLQGTLSNAAQLTDTLAGAEEDISGLLVNLDDLFTTLASRAGKFGSLNSNLAAVLTTLAESRADLEATLANLADLTNEVGDLVRDHRTSLDQDLDIAARITSTVLRNRASVEESLSWLPVVGKAARNAYHPNPIDATDVRDNTNAKIQCEVLDPLPDSPLKDILMGICQDETGEPPPGPSALVFQPDEEEPLPDCTKGVRKVKRQVKKLSEIDLDQSIEDEMLKPLKKHLKKLGKKCKKLGETIKDPKELLEDLLDKIGDIPPTLQDTLENTLDEVDGSAATTVVAPTEDEDDGSWFGGLFDFVGWSW